MRKNTDKEPSSPGEIVVKLKPIFGMKPGMYLTVLYSSIIVLFLFFLVVFPGLRKNGSKVEFVSLPVRAAVYVDGKYAGATPCMAFLSKGTHDITIHKPYYEEQTFEQKIPGRIFFSLFSPKKIKISRDLTLEDEIGFINWVFTQCSDFSLLENLFTSYQIPTELSHAVYDLYSTKNFNKTNLIDLLLVSSLKNINNRVLLKDYVKASTKHVSAGGVLSPGSLLSLCRTYLTLQTNNKRLVYWLSALLPEDEQDSVYDSQWFSVMEEQYKRHLSSIRESGDRRIGDPVAFSGTVFYPVAEGEFIKGDLNGDMNSDIVRHNLYTLPHKQTVERYYIMSREITKSQFQLFILDNPYWDVTNKKVLIEAGKVDEHYLESWDLLKDDQPVNFVSYYAAEAFCIWLSTKLPDSLQHYRVTLPSETQWEYIADFLWKDTTPLFQHGENSLNTHLSVESFVDNGVKIKQLNGNLWEWCRNWYFPMDYYFESTSSKSDEQLLLHSGSEKAVRGGSWANRSEEISPATRGSHPPEWCTPFLGFRPVIVRK